MLDSMRCSKCRLIQLAAPACQSCGTPSPRPVIRQASASAPAARRPVTEAPRPTAPPAPPAAVPHPAAASSPASFDADGDRTGLVDKPTRASATVTAMSEGVGDASTERRLTFEGQGGALFGIQIVNVFLTLLTLGIYSFWGKVRVRSYLMSQTEFEGDRFAYHGTGKELYRGAVKAGLVFGGLSALLNASQVMPKGAPQISAVLAAYLGLSLLVPVAIVGARRYRLSRTSWRNIRFAFRGNTGAFIKLFLKGSLLTGLTFGLYYPFFATNQHAFLISNSYFGDKSFGFNGHGRHLFGPYALALLLTVPTLGLVWFWFWARRTRYYWEHTSFATARFQSTMTAWRLFSLHAGNLLLLIVTLGVAWPWATIRKIRVEFANLSLVGPLDAALVKQDAQAATATGDSLGQFLDADMGLAA